MRSPEYAGHKFAIECLELGDGSCPAGEFLDALSLKDRQKFDTLFERLGDHGMLKNKEKFKKVEGSDGIFAFKSFQARILCFFTRDQQVVLAYGLIKKTDRYKAAEIERAEAYRNDFFARREASDDE